MALPGYFPLLVQGSWGPDPPKNLPTKLQVYFQSPKRSGGGECVVSAVPGSAATFLVVFSQEDVRQKVLERKNHELVWPGKGIYQVTVQLPTSPDELHEDSAEQIENSDVSEELESKLSLSRSSGKLETMPKEGENTSSLVAFEELKDNVTDLMVTLLVENVSGLSANNDDFRVEIIRDLNVAVVVFQKHIDTMKFIEDYARYHSAKQLELSLRPLEVTKVIRVENLPPGVDEYCLKLFFENPYNGGGAVDSVQYFQKESSALVEFSDRKALDTIMTKKLALNKMPLSVFPYYPSLGTALYGKEKPLIKLPAPLEVPLPPPVWKFLKEKKHLVDEINSEMRDCHCELIWPQHNGIVIIRPAPTLVSQGRQRIYSWTEDASKAFSAITAKYPVIRFPAAPIVWDTIKDDFKDDKILIEFDALVDMVSFVGKLEDVQSIEPQIKKAVESITQKIEREQQSLKEEVSISPGRYTLLSYSALPEKLKKQCLEVELSYSADNGQLCIGGLRSDVYKVKGEIQEMVHTMVQKSVQIPPEVFQFLQQVDCKAFSAFLFRDKKRLVTYELEGAAVLLIGSSPEVLAEAEKQLVSDLNHKRIDIEDRDVLKEKKWKALICSLLKNHNSPSKVVTIKESTSETTSEVIIAGCVRSVKEIYSLLFDFVEKHTKIERSIELKSFVVGLYLRAEKKVIWAKTRNKNVRLLFKLENKGKDVLITGPKIAVLETMKAIQQVQDSICMKSICIEKPGASHFFKDKERYCKGEVRRLFGCYIELQEEGEKKREVTDGKQCRARAVLAPGVLLLVQQGDLTQFPVDGVVNASSENLKHTGGLAAALLKVAGPELLVDCQDIIKAKGKIPPGSAVISKAGKLPCQWVIHAVGPQWKREEAPQCINLLKKAVTESLHLAEKHQYQSIAIPAISSGAFGFPLDQCVNTIVLAIKEDFQRNRNGRTLREIYLVDSSEKVVEAFAETVKTLFKEEVLDNAPLPNLPSAHQPRMRKDSGNSSILTSPEGLSLHLLRGDIQDVKTDIVVNSISPDLVLNRGPLSRAILEKAGLELQKELEDCNQRLKVGVGTVLLTRGYNLHCQHVLHVVPPQWANDTSSKKIMEAIIQECLETTESLALKSITFPAIGTGNLGFPKTIFAELMISEVVKFSSKIQPIALQEVHFLLHPSDHETIQAFSDEFARRANGNLASDKIPMAADTQASYGTVSSPSLGVHEMKIGPVTFQVTSGDITKAVADVIVNSTSKTFTLKAGVSKAILECAGKDVENELALQAQQGKHSYIITKGGLLFCKNIIHVIGGNDVKKSVSCVLQECEKRNFKSICLPAIGTGNAKQDPDTVATAMLDTIEEFIQKGSVHSVEKVQVVILLPQVLNVFFTNMKKREGSLFSVQPSRLSKLTSFFGLSKQSPKKPKALVLEKETEPAVFQVCGDNERSIRSAISWIKNLIEKEQFTYTNEDNCIRDFDEKEYQELNALQKHSNICISLDQQKPLVKVSGINRDVITASRAIEEMIKKVREARDQEAQADCISEFIEWQYNDSDTFCAFDKMTNLQLENAKRAKQKTVSVKIKDQSYTVNLHTNTATDARGHSLAVQRLSKSEVVIPANWSDTKQQSCAVELLPGNPEYNVVASKFNKTCSNFTILKIERIQNPDLWNCYQAKKKTMDAKNSLTVNEKILFHGTDANSVPHVNQNGFNRSYAGKNATAFGKGTYFAVNANYSAQDTYSQPDANGNKHMYYVRVLTGVYTVGEKSLIVPPPKSPQDPTDQYDTVTDNMQKPNLFVVFYDYQAYPEYLITFKK
ncbi:protein mono-ADP-ribosyltransferase PARP14 [Rhynchocyon petersi]